MLGVLMILAGAAKGIFFFMTVFWAVVLGSFLRPWPFRRVGKRGIMLLVG